MADRSQHARPWDAGACHLNQPGPWVLVQCVGDNDTSHRDQHDRDSTSNKLNTYEHTRFCVWTTVEVWIDSYRLKRRAHSTSAQSHHLFRTRCARTSINRKGTRAVSMHLE